VAARAGVVNEIGDDFLAGAALAGDEHVALAIGNHANEIEHRPHARAVAHDDRIW
jgi:hypothetical protein